MLGGDLMRSNSAVRLVELLASADAWQAASTAPSRPAIAGERPTQRRGAMLAVLFEASRPTCHGGPDGPSPLWAEEAMHRTVNLLQLVMTLEQRTWHGGESAISAQLELALARNLANALGALDLKEPDAVLPCSDALRSVTSNLVALFGPTVGDIRLRTSLGRLALLANKKRALVLAAHELVVNAVKHAFCGLDRGDVVVTLDRPCATTARLRVEDDGLGFSAERPGMGLSIIASLASVLEAGCVYRRSRLGGTAAELLFPVARMATTRLDRADAAARAQNVRG
jgi:two-component sensor histidine kinase